MVGDDDLVAIDLATGPAFEVAVDNVIVEHLSALIIDLSGVTFMSAIGIAILASAKDRLNCSAGFAVVADGRPISRPIELTGLVQRLSLCRTRDEALSVCVSDRRVPGERET